MLLNPQTEIHRPMVLVSNDIRNVAILKLDHIGDCYYILSSPVHLIQHIVSPNGRNPPGAMTHSSYKHGPHFV